jgi:hypothetical protein
MVARGHMPSDQFGVLQPLTQIGQGKRLHANAATRRAAWMMRSTDGR